MNIGIATAGAVAALSSAVRMQPFRQSSLVQQPDGEIIRAIVDQGSLSDADSGIQFDLGALSLKLGQEEAFIQEPAHFEAPGQPQAH